MQSNDTSKPVRLSLFAKKENKGAVRICNGRMLAAIHQTSVNTPQPLSHNPLRVNHHQKPIFQSTTTLTSPIPTPPRPHKHMTVQASLPSGKSWARVMSARQGRPRRKKILEGSLIRLFLLRSRGSKVIIVVEKGQARGCVCMCVTCVRTDSEGRTYRVLPP